MPIVYPRVKVEPKRTRTAPQSLAQPKKPKRSSTLARPVLALEEGWEIIDRDGSQMVQALVRDMRGGRPFTPTKYRTAA